MHPVTLMSAPRVKPASAESENTPQGPGEEDSGFGSLLASLTPVAEPKARHQVTPADPEDDGETGASLPVMLLNWVQSSREVVPDQEDSAQSHDAELMVTGTALSVAVTGEGQATRTAWCGPPGVATSLLGDPQNGTPLTDAEAPSSESSASRSHAPVSDYPAIPTHRLSPGGLSPGGFSLGDSSNWPPAPASSPYQTFAPPQGFVHPPDPAALQLADPDATLPVNEDQDTAPALLAKVAMEPGGIAEDRSSEPPFAQGLAAERHCNGLAPIVGQAADFIRFMLQGRRTEAHIRLHPEHLGTVTVRLVLQEGVLRAILQAQDPGVRALLEANTEQLRQRMAESGLSYERLEVTVGSEPAFDQADRRHRETASGGERQRGAPREGVGDETPVGSQRIAGLTGQMGWSAWGRLPLGLQLDALA